MDLWDRALQQLGQEDRQSLLNLSVNPREALLGTLKAAEAKRDAAYQKRWSFTRSNGSKVIIRDVLEKIVHSITTYAKAVDVAVNAAPLYASPPWAVIRFLLQVIGLTISLVA